MAMFDNGCKFWYYDWYSRKMFGEAGGGTAKENGSSIFPVKTGCDQNDRGSSARKLQVTVEKRKSDPDAEVLWVIQSYHPRDTRHNVPVSRRKFLFEYPPKKLEKSFHPPEKNTLQPKAGKEYATPFIPTFQNTRCEEWSTLRAMLPSRGLPIRKRESNWATAAREPPVMSSKKLSYFPRINNPMTTFVDITKKSDPLFQLY